MSVQRWLPILLCSLLVIACGGGSGTSDDPPGAQCADGRDNDDDGMTDFPDDLGCRDADDDAEGDSVAAQCDDNRDNDGDGKTDYPQDPGCFAPQADDESDDCPDGPGCAQCSNGKDDDANGQTDYPADTGGCESAADNSEFVNNPEACGPGLKIKQLPPTGMDMGQLEMGSQSNIVSECGGGAGVFAVAYVLHLTEPKVVVATTDMPGTATDTILDIRGQMCSEPTSGLACNDDISTANNASTVTKSLAAGVYYIIVQGQNAGVSGAYQLSVTKYAGEGSACSAMGDCGPGLYCRVPAGQSAMVCAKSVCEDGLDDDADGKIDYPNDPGCGSTLDETENDACPDGAGCPECGNGMDDDSDGMTDYPADDTCKAAGDSSESCVTTEGVPLLTGPLTPGDTATATDDIKLSCASTTSGPDLHYRLDVPALQTLSVGLAEKSSSFWSAAVGLLPSSCTGAALACSTSPDPETVTLSNVAAGTYYFVVDGQYSSSTGSFKVAVSGKFPNGAACENDFDGAFTCATGYTCKGAVGNKTCQPAQCNDGADNNSNGKTDYPADPGCQTSSDDTETTVCPGPMCPVCSNGLDDDMDTLTDYPADTSCLAASGNNEACISSEPVVELTTAMTTGLTTVGATNDTKGCASSSTATAPDIHHLLDLPAMQTVSVEVTKPGASWDSVIGLYNSTCTGAHLACADFSPEKVTGTNLAAGRYYVVVDGWSSASGAYDLQVSGTIANGGSCEVPLAQSGAITCGVNHACKGPTGNKTCQLSQCADGMDNNGDGKTDYPNDAGCASSSDDTENTVCPGAMCPACGNGADDDSDTQVDYPMDFGCSAAGATSEAFCPNEPDYAMSAISTPATSGNLMAAADNYDQTCYSFTGNDMAFALHLPVPVATLVVDTENSTISDTIISLKDAACGIELGCDDDTGSGSLSKITATNVPAGNYAIQVDSYSTTNNGAFTLNVKGTVAPQTACSHALFTSGVLVCPTGTSCTGNPKKCQ